MRKVTTINLNNNAFQMDEEGYDALRSYLENAARSLAGNPDRDEILSDLEQAIADKCRLTLGPHKTVVSEAEIRRIIEEMGPVAGGAEQADPPSGAAEQAPGGGNSSGTAPGYRQRRLYRIREGQKLAGICQGLSAYADVDVSMMRLGVILATVFTGFVPGVFVYFVLVLVLPVASTPEEMAAAHGQPFSAQEVVDRVKKKHDDWRARRREKRNLRHTARWSPQPVTQPPPGPAARLTGGLMLPLLTVASATWFAVMATAAYALWHAWYRVGFDAWPPGSWHGPADIPRWVAMAAVLAVYALVSIPIGAARRSALYYANGGQPHGWANGWSGLLWFAVAAILLLAAWYVMPQLHGELWQQLHPARGISI